MTTNGQSGNLRLGDEEFQQMNYTRAILAYEAASDKNLRAYRNLAHSYKHIGKFSHAESCLAIVYASGQRKPEDLWNYSQVLLRQGKYQKARRVLNEFYTISPRDSRAKAYKNAGDFPNLLKKNSSNFTIKYLPFNNHEQDFGAGIYRKQLVFASTRSRFSPIVREWNGNQKSFLNLFMVNPSLKKARPTPFKRSFNKSLHEGPISFTKNERHCAITRTNYGLKDQKGKQNLGIYFSQFKHDKWSPPTAFPYNDTTYSVGQAALNDDGTIMYFASDMPGGKGGTDIWVSYNKKDGWTEPIPIHSINTEGNEMFPFFLEKGILFFASDGHVGLGGLDIFAAKLEGEKFVKIRNLGTPVNSAADDFGIFTDAKMRHGYFSSNREAPRSARKKHDKRDTLALIADDDIYQVTFQAPFEFGKTIVGTVVDDDGKPIDGVDLALQKVGSKKIQRAITAESGQYEFPIEETGKYILKGTKQWYFDSRGYVMIRDSVEDYNTRLQLKRNPNISIHLLITDSEIGEPMPGVDVTIRNQLTGEVVQHTTTETGDYFKALPQKRLKDSLSYQITVSLDGYLTKTLDYNKKVDHFGSYEIHKARLNNRFLDFSMKKKTIGDDLALQLGMLPYFFGEDKSQIEPDTTGPLKEIARALLDNPGLEIQIVTHTDCQGSAADNLTLSKRRATAIEKYILSKIPRARGRVSSIGLGEKVSESGCSCDAPGGSNCKEDEYQIDRRTEFIITKI